MFKERIIKYYEKKALDNIEDFNQSDIFAEESIYRKSTSQKDNILMKQFHNEDWENRNIIKNKFSDERLTYFANLLIYEEKPEILEKSIVQSIKKSLSKKLLSQNKEKWLTLYDAYKKIDDLREKCDNNALETLNEFNNYLELLEKQIQINKG